jgi:hypothetical protein
VDLRSSAWDARGVAAFREGDFATAHTWQTRRFDLLGEITDPDLLHDMHLSAIPTSAAVGRIREARRLATSVNELVAPLTPHHRLHGVACRLEVEELAGDWASIADLEPEALRIVEDNRDTPCVRNARTLLLCALANELLGRPERARELDAGAGEIESEGFGATLATPRARLALARGELDALEELLADKDWMRRQTWFALPAAALNLDALAIFGDAAAVEAAASYFDRPRSYLQPFGLRALGIIRDDEELLSRADERFRALRLDWYADQTGTLSRFRSLAAR